MAKAKNVASAMKEKTVLWNINDYTINCKDLIGIGAYGIVYKAKDKEDRIVAAKKIDGTRNPRIMKQDLDKLVELNHDNIVKVHSIHISKEDSLVWIFMDYYPNGDLNKYFRTRDVAMDEKLHLMMQIVEGIYYLHARDIIHRDIKPGNILVSDGTPPLAKLTDFDVSKFLDPSIETSQMTSNVGTLAFKAIEFFQRTEQGKISYHRNVDVFACALTFLAMLQAKIGKKEKRILVPQIETPQEPSELHIPSIGQLISERVKYKVKELNIVRLNNTTNDVEIEIKKLILKMTCVKPKDRLPISEVKESLRRIRSMHEETLGAAENQKLRK